MIKFLDLQKQYHSLKPEIDAAVQLVMEESAFIGGKYAKIFEESFASYLGGSYCLGVANGTDALEIAIKALDLPPDSEVIVPANTFMATAEAVVNMGYSVVFADCTSDYNISIESLIQKITPRTSAIICVHLYGQPANMEALMEIANEHHLRVVEDCAQAHGAALNGQKVGTFGDIACFSFYPGKNLGAYGDGGAIVTNSKDLLDQCTLISNHGRAGAAGHTLVGRNSRLDGIQAAILSVKLPHLDKWLEIRNARAQEYISGLQGLPLILPIVNNNIYHAWHLFVIRVKSRVDFREYLQNNDIQTGVHYPVAVPKQPAFAQHKEMTIDFFACQTDEALVSLPMGEHLEKADVEYVIQTIKRYYSRD